MWLHIISGLIAVASTVVTAVLWTGLSQQFSYEKVTFPFRIAPSLVIGNRQHWLVPKDHVYAQQNVLKLFEEAQKLLSLDRDITQDDLINAKLMAPVGSPWLVFAHHCQDLRSLTQLLWTRNSFGSIISTHDQPFYSWFQEDLGHIDRVISEVPPVPLTKIVGNGYFVNPKAVAIEDYTALCPLAVHLYWLCTTITNPAVAKFTPQGFSTTTDFALPDFSCCTGIQSSYSPKVTKDNSRPFLDNLNYRRKIKQHDWYGPGMYGSRTWAVVTAKNDQGFIAGWAMSIYSPLAPFIAKQNHEDFEGSIETPVLVGYPFIKAWPAHFTSWVGAVDEIFQGSPGPIWSNIGSVVLLPNKSISIFSPRKEAVSRGRKFHWGIHGEYKTCGHVQVKGQSNDCLGCQFLKRAQGCVLDPREFYCKFPCGWKRSMSCAIYASNPDLGSRVIGPQARRWFDAHIANPWPAQLYSLQSATGEFEEIQRIYEYSYSTPKVVYDQQNNVVVVTQQDELTW